MVNALFRFALEREGDARFAVVRTAIASCAVVGPRRSRRSRRSLTPFAAPLLLGDGNESLWLRLLRRACSPRCSTSRRPASTASSSARSASSRSRSSTSPSRSSLSLVWIIAFDGGALGLVAGSYAGTRSRSLVVAVGPPRRAVRRRRPRAAGPDAALRPAVHALAPRAVGAQPLEPAAPARGSRRSALAGVLRVAACASASAVALLVTAFQLAWPPFAYAIEDDEEARRVYRAVLTCWLLVALAAGARRSRSLRSRLIALLGGRAVARRPDPMALLALGFGFYGAYYAVGVAVGRVKRTQLNWVVTGIAAIANVVLCIVLIPPYGATGAAAASAIAYLLMAVLMVVRGEQRLPRRLRLARASSRSCALAAIVFAAGELRRSRPAARPARGSASSSPRCFVPAGAQRRSGSAPRQRLGA